jgi:hypothetical protein
MVGALIGGRERMQTEQAKESLDYKLGKVHEEFVIQREREKHGLPPSKPFEKTKDKEDDQEEGGRQ